jgi:hypothetical protein
MDKAIPARWFALGLSLADWGEEDRTTRNQSIKGLGLAVSLSSLTE